MTPSTALMIEKCRQLAAEGKTYRQAAVKLGVSYNYVAGYASRYDISFKLMKRGRKSLASPGDREERMKVLYLDGKTLAEIGVEFRITRERVRQLLTKFYGITARAGGQAERARRKKRDLNKVRDAKSMKVWGCSYREYKRILKHEGRPTYAFWSQRRNARTRNISWELNLHQWWKIWEQSGHWSERGRGHGYCMCRLNDVGPYSVDNVYIATGSDNMKDFWVNKRSSVPTEVAA